MRLHRPLSYIVGIVISVACLWLAIRHIDTDVFLDALKQANTTLISVGSSISRVQVFWNRLPQERQGTWVSLIFVAIVLISSAWLRFKSRPDTI